MHRFALLLVAMLAITSAALAQRIVAEKIALQFVPPSVLADFLKTGTSSRSVSEEQPDIEEPLLPSGIVRITPDDRKNTLTVHGTRRLSSK